MHVSTESQSGTSQKGWVLRELEPRPRGARVLAQGSWGLGPGELQVQLKVEPLRVDGDITYPKDGMGLRLGLGGLIGGTGVF